MSSDKDEKLREIKARLNHQQQSDIEQGPRRSLYDVLQENQAKQQQDYDKEYQERNALHRLDDDEIEYLESISTREKQMEEAIRKDLERGLSKFSKPSSGPREISVKPTVSKPIPMVLVKKKKRDLGIRKRTKVVSSKLSKEDKATKNIEDSPKS